MKRVRDFPDWCSSAEDALSKHDRFEAVVNGYEISKVPLVVRNAGR